jgi:hypothetical protein
MWDSGFQIKTFLATGINTQPNTFIRQFIPFGIAIRFSAGSFDSR